MKEQFHEHLEICAQYREHPFDLCVIGAALLVVHSPRDVKGVIRL